MKYYDEKLMRLLRKVLICQAKKKQKYKTWKIKK